MLRIHNVKIELGKDNFKKILSQTLNIREKQIYEVKLVKQSIDARRDKVYMRCSFDFAVEDEESILKRNPQLKKVEPYQYHYYPKNNRKVVIVGCGPAGLFCAYVLAQVGQDVTVVERGQPIEQRVLDVDNLLKNGKLKNYFLLDIFFKDLFIYYMCVHCGCLQTLQKRASDFCYGWL